jgi:hypothetical protein
MEKETKCFCGEQATLKHEELKLMGGKVIIKDAPYYECTKCGDKFSTNEQMFTLSEKVQQLRKEQFNFKRPVINAGRSLAITFPTDLAKYCGIKKGNIAEIIPHGKKELLIKLS